MISKSLLSDHQGRWGGGRPANDDQRSRGWPANTGHPWKECVQDVRAVHEALQEEVVEADHLTRDALGKRPLPT